MHCVFTHLLPPDGMHRDPCAILLETTGHRGALREPLVLVDQRLAVERVMANDAGALRPLLSMQPVDFCLEDAVGAVELRDALRSLGVVAPILLPDQQPERSWAVYDYGSFTPAILQNGLTLTTAPCGRLKRPDRVSIAHSSMEDIQAILHAHATALPTWFSETAPQGAHGVVLEGLADRRWWLRQVLDVIARSPLHVRTIREWAPAEVAELTALEEVVARRLQGRDVRLEIPGQPHKPTLQDLHATVEQVRVVHPRRADDSARTTAFSALKSSRQRGGHSEQTQAAVEAALGPPEGWIQAYRRHLYTSTARVVLLPTWQCELRCVYCAIGKTDAREMSQPVGESALELLFSAPTPTVELAFFGGEPLLRWDLVRSLCNQAHARAQQEGRAFRMQVTTNAWAMSEAVLNDLQRWNSHVQLSLDGDSALQNRQRRPRTGGDSYAQGPAKWLPEMHARGIDYRVIMVITPDSVGQMAESFAHVLSLGARCIQLNYAIGIPWDQEACAAYAKGLQAIGAQIESVWENGGSLSIINLQEPATAVRNNLHVTVDFDGTIYGGNAFLVQAAHRERFALGHVDDGHGWHRYMADGKTDADIFALWRRRASLANTRRVGNVEASFVRFMQARHPGRLRPGRGRSA